MVGGEVVEVNGRKAIRLPDGRLLMKHQAYVKARTSGWRSEQSRIWRLPRWIEELSKAFYPAVPAEELLRALEVKVKVKS